MFAIWHMDKYCRGVCAPVNFAYIKRANNVCPYGIHAYYTDRFRFTYILSPAKTAGLQVILFAKLADNQGDCFDNFTYNHRYKGKADSIAPKGRGERH